MKGEGKYYNQHPSDGEPEIEQGEIGYYQCYEDNRDCAKEDIYGNACPDAIDQVSTQSETLGSVNVILPPRGLVHLVLGRDQELE